MKFQMVFVISVSLVFCAVLISVILISSDGEVGSFASVACGCSYIG